MSFASVLKSDLASLPVRLITTEGSGLPGLRTIGKGDLVPKKDEDGNILGIIGNAFLKMGGFLFGITGWLIGGIATTAVTWFVQAVNFVMNFNWNASDRELDAMLGRYVSLIGGQIGGTIGNALGWITCGIVPGAIIYKFNALLGVQILMDVGEEALEELAWNLALVAQTIVKGTAASIAIQSFKGFRRTVKILAGEKGSKAARVVDSLFGGGTAANLRKWGEEGGKPWTFTKARDELIEKLPDGFVEEFAEELIEEWWDGCVEALYVVAADTDQWLFEQKLAKETRNGPEEVVEIRPNRENEEEKIVLAGPQELIKPIIAQTMVQHQMLDERDLGLWVGEPLRKTMIAPPFPIMLRVILSDREGILNGAKRVQITVPDVRREKLGWSDLKAAVGGPNGYMWGPWRTNARLDGGSEIHVYTASEQEGLDLVARMAIFSNQEIVGITSVRERREGARRRLDTLQKQPTRIYPYGFTILNQQKVINEEAGTATLSGVYQRRKTSIIPLWTDTQPDGYSELIAELFRSPRADV
jgi:hypothetical protein